jgi:SAM-dependent methyltransferase
MKSKLYSSAHVKTANKLFSKKDISWYNEQWTDSEINECKAIELKMFIDKPSLKTYPKPELIDQNRKPSELQLIANKYLSGYKTFLSIGCGLGETEMWFAKQHPNIVFTAIDNAPYVEGLNNVALDLGLTNITFIHSDLRTANLGKFDVVFSYAVIYCIPDDYLEGYFKQLCLHTSPNGLMLVGCSSNLFFLSKLKALIKPSRPTQLMKQTGWRRDVGHVRRYIPNYIHTEKTYHFNHFFNPSLPRFMCEFSKRYIPITNPSYMFVLRH